VQALLRLVEEAQGVSEERERTQVAGRINQRLDTLAAAGGGSRKVADVFHHLLEAGRLKELEDEEGHTCRAAAVEGLLSLGFPYALEVRPEDLEHLRKVQRPRSSIAWAPLMAFAVLAGGLLAQWLTLPEALPPEEFGGLVLQLGLSLLALVGAAPEGQGSPLGRVSLAVLVGVSLVGVLMGVLAGRPGALVGLAGLLACLLLLLPRR
jgi:hypothetical protein